MIFLGIGSNLSSRFGDRFKNINLALYYLKSHKINVLKKSNFSAVFQFYGGYLKKINIQQKNLDKWTKENPEWMNNPDSQHEYLMLVKNCTDNLKENKREEKVIKNICNEVYLKDNIE